MRVMEAVIRRTLFDNPEAVARVMTVARTQLDAHIAAGRNIRPAMVRDAAPSIRQDVVRGRDPAMPPNPRPGREPKPQERSSEERRVGKEGVNTCKSRGSPYP